MPFSGRYATAVACMEHYPCTSPAAGKAASCHLPHIRRVQEGVLLPPLPDSIPLRVKAIPANNKGRMTNIDVAFPEKDLKKMPSPTKARMNITPPVISFFHAMISATISTNAGILCTRNPSSCLPMGALPPNTSNENITMKRIARAASIRANHLKIKSNLFILP